MPAPSLTGKCWALGCNLYGMHVDRIFQPSSATIKEQVHTVAHADILVQTHGSALGNLMFLKEVIQHAILSAGLTM